MNETIYFGGGCFWCTEAIFQKVKGIKNVKVGYSDEIEVSKVEYDSEKTDLNYLLEVFFATHDPTSKDKQIYDVGKDYRSAIFYTVEKQKKIVQEFIKKKQKEYSKKIVTQISRLKYFEEAEYYHQNFYKNNKNFPYCKIIIDPKLEKLKNFK